MTEPQRRPKNQHYLEILEAGLERGRVEQLTRFLDTLHPAEVADLLESLPRTQRMAAWELVPEDKDGEVLAELGEDVRNDLIRAMDAEELAAAASHLDVDDSADLLMGLPEAVIEEVLASLDKQDRQRLEAVLQYGKDSAGGLMDTDTVTVRPSVTVDVVLRYLRRRGQLPPSTDMLFVVNREDRYLGRVSLARIVTEDPELTVAEILDQEFEPLADDLPANEIARLFEDRDLISAPVVDQHRRLLGRITIDDVVDVIRDQANSALLAGTGLREEEDIFGPLVPASVRRGIWLGLNLFTAFLAAWVIGLFEATLQQLVALAVLMPIVASMGGIAGTQTLTLAIRGLALGQLGSANMRFMLVKELGVAALNGLVWALVVAAIAGLWFQNPGLSAIIAAAILINIASAAFAGVGIPVLLHRFGIDPALAGGVILTTVTDIVGFLSFLGLAALLLV